MPIECISVAGAARTDASVRRVHDSPRGWRLRIQHHLDNPRASGFALVRRGTISVTGNAVSWDVKDAAAEVCLIVISYDGTYCRLFLVFFEVRGSVKMSPLRDYVHFVT